MNIFKIDQNYFLWSKMTLSVIISTKASESPGKSRKVRTFLALRKLLDRTGLVQTLTLTNFNKRRFNSDL